MTRVFISYSHQDGAIVDHVITTLHQHGISLWIDHKNLPLGTPNWDTSIRQGISQTDFVLYLASPDAVQSNYVLSELHIAHDLGKMIIPMMLGGDRWSSVMPVGFVTTQGLDARGNALTPSLMALIGYINNSSLPAIEYASTGHVSKAGDKPPTRFTPIRIVGGILILLFTLAIWSNAITYVDVLSRGALERPVFMTLLPVGRIMPLTILFLIGLGLILWTMFHFKIIPSAPFRTLWQWASGGSRHS